MTRRAWLLAAMLAVVAGCGESHPPSPSEQGMSLMRGGSYTEAIDAFSKAIQLNPRDPDPYLQRGRAYQCRNTAGDLNAAIADFTSAIQFNPRDSEAYYSRAIAYRDRGTATNSPQDAKLSSLDDMQARRLDPRISYEETEPDLPAVPPPPEATPLAAEPAAEQTEAAAAETKQPADAPAAEEPESAASVVRRLEAEAHQKEAAAKAASGRPGASNQSGTRTPRTSPRGASGTATDDALRTRRSATTATSGGPAAADGKRTPRHAGGASAAARHDPRDPRPITEYDPRSQGAADAPTRYSNGPLYGAGGTAGAGQQVPGAGSAIAPQVPQYRSPFPQRSPRPTGFIQEQPFDATGRQPRPYYTPPPRIPRDELR